jgi:hypothetical protein
MTTTALMAAGWATDVVPFGQPYTPLKPPTDGAADNGAYEDSLAFTRPIFPSPVFSRSGCGSQRSVGIGLSAPNYIRNRAAPAPARPGRRERL